MNVNDVLGILVAQLHSHSHNSHLVATDSWSSDTLFAFELWMDNTLFILRLECSFILDGKMAKKGREWDHKISCA